MVYSQLQEATRNEQIDVGVASVVVSEARNNLNLRKVIVLRNTSDNDADIITINLGFNKATSNNGVVLRKNEAFSDTTETGYKCHQGVITGICATVNGKLSIYER